MKKALYEGLISKLATLVPWFARPIIDMAIERAGKHSYEEISPLEMLDIIKNDINPRLSNQISDYNSILTAGAGLLITNAEDRIVHLNPIMGRLIAPILETGLNSPPTDEEMFGLLQQAGLVKPAGEVASIEVKEFFCPEIARHLNVSMARIGGLEPGENAASRRGLCCIVQDVTLKEAILDELGEFFTEQKQMQASLARSDRMASMGLLAAGVAHEINNPLTYLLFNLGNLANDLPELVSALTRMQLALGPERTREILGVDNSVTRAGHLNDLARQAREAREGANRVRYIVRDLRTFSRVDEDREVPVALNGVIEGAINMTYNEIKYRARLVKQYDELPTIMANDGKLSQVFSNLLVNASHAITEGDVGNNKIVVRTWTSGDQICAEVRDTGRGISSEHIPHIFDPFFTTKDVGIGSGLGLSICENIVNNMGGAITVESEEGEGTSFVVRLPVGAESKESPYRLPNDSASVAVRGRFMIVDDEVHVGRAMKRMLDRQHEVVVTTSGAMAKQLLEQDQGFDGIICDLMMPQITGMDLHSWLEERYPVLARRMVFVTGGAFTPKAKAFLNRVDNPRLEKPFDPKNLKAYLREMSAR